MNNYKNLTIEETFKLAIQNHVRKNFDIAQDLYQKVIKIDPNHSSSHNNLGAVYKVLKKYPKAINCFKKAIEIKPNYIDAHYNLGILCLQLEENQKAKFYFEKIIKIDKNHIKTHYNLGIVYKILKEYPKAIKCYEKIIEINPKYVDAYNNLGILFKQLGRYQEAKSCYEKLIHIDPNYDKVYNNLGNLFYTLGDTKKAIYYYQKFIAIKPDDETSLYNLGIALHSDKEYKKAIEQFKLTNFGNSKSFLLSCLYELNDKSTFINELDIQIKQGTSNAIIGSLISRSEIKYGIKRLNPFCGDPLKYAIKTDLSNHYDFKNLFAKTIKDFLKEGIFSFREQGLLTNGNQTAGDLFSEKKELLKKIKDIIHLEVDRYYEYFKESNEGFIKNWPKSYKINAWLVNMKSGGSLSPHIHELGWLSGSVYINVPPKSETDSGNLVVCMGDNKYEKNKKKIMDVITGSLCLFPSSLYHYTVPFDSKENRIVLAFDVLTN